ncbi:sigma-70 family RNA polymerase sigma factor [Luteolibacter sp. LG18]|uniref:sigma-70 family RNA polymerase sigma factor n=1 Tax=Luteolibacter sp. LG18 TaxID=2819286 RepID=UPI002B2D8511|nr:hypothetical protein llg_32850 [Luteolibacter sp. LG18]
MSDADEQRKALVQQHFVKHIVPLRGYLLGLTADFHRVDDLVQETFLAVVEKANGFQEGTNFRAWVFAIARFKLLSSIRDAGREPLTFQSDVVELLAEEAPDFMANEPRARFIQPCMKKLGPQARRCLELFYQHGHPPREIAPLMGWSVNAVKVALSRARAAVRECIERNLAREEVAP